MNFTYSLMLAILIGSGIYMLLRRSLMKMLIGFGLMGHAINLMVFSSGGLEGHHPPIIESGARTLEAGVAADPLPQALVLTAIVIGFGAQIFLLVLLRAAYLRRPQNDIQSFTEDGA